MRLIQSLRHAGQGLFACLRTERNMRVHLAATLYLLYFVWIRDFFALTRIERAVLLLAAALVWIAELVNTSLERLADLACPAVHPLVKLTKDIAAAAVLAAAVFALLIGVIVLWRPGAFAAAVDYYRTNPIRFLLLLLSFIPAGCFIADVRRL